MIIPIPADQDEQTIQAGGQAIPDDPRGDGRDPGAPRRLGTGLPPARAGGPGPARPSGPACPAPEPARASSQPKQHASGAEPTGHLTPAPTSGRTSSGRPWRTTGPAMRGRRQWPVRRRGDCYDPRRRQPLRRMPTTYRRCRLPPATRSPNVASTSNDADVSRANTRRYDRRAVLWPAIVRSDRTGRSARFPMRGPSWAGCVMIAAMGSSGLGVRPGRPGTVCGRGHGAARPAAISRRVPARLRGCAGRDRRP